MTPAEIKSSLPTRMERLGISASLLSSLSGIDASQISRWFRGKDRLTFENAQILNRRVELLEELTRLAAPLPLDFRDVDLILDLGKRLAIGQLEIRVKDHFMDSLIAGGVNALAGK